MASDNEYRLIIEINDNTTTTTTKSPIATPTKKVDAEKLEMSRTKTATRIVKYDIGRSFLNTTKSIIQNEVDTYYGSGELSQRINMGMSMVNTAYSTAVKGTILSSALGISTMAGVGVATGLLVFQKTLEITTNYIEINNKQRIENEQLQLLRGRAGIQFNRSRVGE